MGLQVFFGNGIYKHETALVQQCASFVQENPEHEVFFLVPNYMKFQTEKRVLKEFSLLMNPDSQDAFSTTNLQVFSFSRLAWFLLLEEAKMNHLSVEGMRLLIKKVLTENQDALSVFQKSATKRGFAVNLLDFFQELDQANIAVDDLEDFQNSNGLSENEKKKFKELTLMFQAFQELKVDYELPVLSLLDQLSEKIETLDLSKTMIVIHGFTRFTAEEFTLIQKFCKIAKEVKISLLSDKFRPTEEPYVLDTFYESKKTAKKLFEFAQKEKIHVLFDGKVEKADSPLVDGINLAWLEKKNIPTPEGLHILTLPNVFEEVRWVASEIQRIVRSTSIQYSDIQVLIRDLNLYDTHFSTIFQMLDIPITFDRNANLRNHPFIEFVLSLFAMDEYGYQTNDVFRFLKTDLILPNVKELNAKTGLSKYLKSRLQFREKVDFAENYCLKYGIQSRDYFAKKWTFLPEMVASHKTSEAAKSETFANEILEFIKGTIHPFFKKLKAVKTGMEASQLLYDFFIDLGIEENLRLMQKDELNTFGVHKAKSVELAWNAVMQLLEEYVELFGEEEFNFEVFREVFLFGLEEVSVGKVPHVLDSVEVISSELVQPMEKKIVFAIGLTNNVLPKNYTHSSVLTIEEKEAFSKYLESNFSDKYFSHSVNEQNAKEEFTAYCIFASATEHLYLTTPVNVVGDKESKISPFVQYLARNCNLHIENVTQTQLASPSARAFVQNLLLLEHETESYQAFLQNVQSAEFPFLERVLSEIGKENVPAPIGPALAESLYPGDLFVSVSRMEQFYNCEYKHFLNYGLKLKERDRFDLDAATKGSYFHEWIDLFMKKLKDEGIELSELDDDDLIKFQALAQKEVEQNPTFSLLQKDARMRYLTEKLRAISNRVAWILREQAKRSSLSSVETELVFGQVEKQIGIDGLELILPPNSQGVSKKMTIRGMIDRVDQLEWNGEKYVAVIDYKSSEKKFDLRKSFYGLSQQMLTYLDVMEENGNKALGALYFHLKNPLLNYNPLYEVEENLEKEILMENKLQGLLIHNDGLLQATKNKEDLYPYPLAKKKDGDFKNTDALFGKDEYQILKELNRALYVRGGERIQNGELVLNPVVDGEKPIACKYCQYKSVCRFDPMLKENNYRKLAFKGKHQKEAILKEMKKGGKAIETTN
ncbi:MAG: PD-(D/E)XK nuclease family protein [Streptococcaceae bacterium]|jgi:ATP-dependent helicase/nuclease subunit B|nr:PD-(D/E)XK nuclease family protein [Streptococcaceae bacterium]